MNKQLILSKKASTNIDELDQSFQLITRPIQIPADGILMQTKYISVDPIMKVWLTQAKTYLSKLELGDVIHAFCLSSPINNPHEFYFGASGLQSYFIYDKSDKNKMLIRIPKGVVTKFHKYQIPYEYLLSLVLNGLPSYYGLVDFCKINKGKNVLISAAAGATGLFAIQLALHYECNVIGLTSSQEKINFLKSNFPKLKVISYTKKDWDQDLFKDGIDAYFDNVGDYMLDTILPHMKENGRIALCGSMGSSQNYHARKGLKNFNYIIFKRLKFKGVTFNQELNKIQQAFDDLMNLIISKKLLIIQQKYKGIEAVPKALQSLYRGQNIGKIVVTLDYNIQCKL